MELNRDKILALVQGECRDLGIYYTAVEPITWIITNLWYVHGHWNWFEIPGHDKYHPFNHKHGEYYRPDPSTLCLYHCLEKIKRFPKQFFIEAPMEIGNEQYTVRSTDSPQQVQTPALSIAGPRRDREQGV